MSLNEAKMLSLKDKVKDTVEVVNSPTETKEKVGDSKIKKGRRLNK